MSICFLLSLHSRKNLNQVRTQKISADPQSTIFTLAVRFLSFHEALFLVHYEDDLIILRNKGRMHELNNRKKVSRYSITDLPRTGRTHREEGGSEPFSAESDVLLTCSVASVMGKKLYFMAAV